MPVGFCSCLRLHLRLVGLVTGEQVLGPLLRAQETQKSVACIHTGECRSSLGGKLDFPQVALGRGPEMDQWPSGCLFASGSPPPMPLTVGLRQATSSLIFLV